MEYKKYQHIERLGTSEVEGILDGKVYLFYKIDGTNSCIFLKGENELGFGSRNREIFLIFVTVVVVMAVTVFLGSMKHSS